MTDFEKWIKDMNGEDKASLVDKNPILLWEFSFSLQDIQREAFEEGQRHPIQVSTMKQQEYKEFCAQEFHKYCINHYQHRAELFGRAATRAIDRNMKKLWLYYCEYFQNKTTEEKHKEMPSNDANVPVL
jgi:hypothetical protein